MSIEPCLWAEMFMERLRRDSRQMSREQLLGGDRAPEPPVLQDEGRG